MKINELQQVPKNKRGKLHKNGVKASSQADNFVLDLRRIKRPANESENDALKEFKKSSRIKHMLLITKIRKLLDFRK